MRLALASLKTIPSGPLLQSMKRDGAAPEVRGQSKFIREGDMENGYVLVRLNADGVMWTLVGEQDRQVTGIDGVSARAVDNGVRIKVFGHEPTLVGRDSMVDVKGHRLTCHRARWSENGRYIAWLGKDMVAGSPQMLRVFHVATRAASASLPVMIVGETGTGKEMVARCVHECGPRADNPFVTVNLAAVPGTLAVSEMFGWTRGAFTGAVDSRGGAFEAVGRGTLFLDEVFDAAPDVQASLLRAVESRETHRIGSVHKYRFEGRVVSASNHIDALSGGTFRGDLFHRLAGLVIHIPPLNQRPGDIGAVVTAAVGEAPTPDAMAVLATHDWPGNIRELLHVLERARWMIGDGRPDAAIIREAISQGLVGENARRSWLAPGLRKDQIERSGMPRSTFYHRLKHGRLSPDLLAPITAG